MALRLADNPMLAVTVATSPRGPARSPIGTSIVQSLQAAGVQVILSLGRANGTEPALNCTSASRLQALYQSVITQYNVKMLDFDIEGGATTNQASMTLRDQALIALKSANPGLVISYTLPVLPSGLIASGVNILNSAKTDGLALDVVNVMAVDYGSADDNGAQMGLDATDAVSATYSRLQLAGLTSTTIGVTPMIGINDTAKEIFQLAKKMEATAGPWPIGRQERTEALGLCHSASDSSY